MSVWKRIAEKGRDLNSSYSSFTKHQRYTPKKVSNDEHSSSRFHNLTIDKLSQSGISQDREKIKERSFIDKPYAYEIKQPRVLKASSSQVHLQKDFLHEPKNSMIAGSFMINIPDDNDRIQKSRMLLDTKKSDKNILFEEVQRMKKQFSIFQTIVLNQLRKQERHINEMIEQIFEKIKEVRDLKEATIQRQIRNKYQLEVGIPPSPCHSENYNNFLKKIQNQDMSLRVSNQMNRITYGSSQPNISIRGDEEIHNQSQNFKRKSFSKFFEAVENLKKDIKDLNVLSNVSSITSPKSSLGRYKWDKWAQLVKMEN